MTVLSPAQTDPSITVSVEKKSILLGEPLRMSIEARFPANAGISFSMPDSITRFEFLAEPAVDSLNENGTAILKGIYTITSFDSGHWVIPSLALTKSIRSDTIGIDVVFTAFNPEQPYHDIKDIIEVQAKKKNPWWWYVAGGGLLLLVLAVYFLRKKKQTPVARPVRRTDPYEEAIRQLEELQRSKPDSKQYYSGLTDIFRLYIFRRKGILSLQKTTDDLVLQLKDTGLAKDEFEKLSQALRLSDFVKFAKYIPAKADDENCYNDIMKTIKAIERSEAKVLPTGRI